MTHHNQLERDLYLRIATELYLKRLIVGGLERVYEIGKNFRNEGVSYKHNPEFTVLEWYEAYADYDDVAAPLRGARRPRRRGRRLRRRDRLLGALAARDAGRRDRRPHEGRHPRQPRSASRSRAAMREQGLEVAPEEDSWGQLVDHLLSKYVEPELVAAHVPARLPGRDLAARQAPPRPSDGLTERWEAFAGGMEFANAFTELNDPDDQRARFEEQRRYAAEGDEEAQPFDEAYLLALEHGMPPTGGIGIGIDRLVMLLTGQRTIREVVLFPAMR